MNRVSKSLVIGLVCVSSAGAHPALAQGKASTFGIMAGVNFAKLGGSDVDGAKTRTGFLAGVFARFGVSKTFAVEPEVLFSQQGAKSFDSNVTGTLKLDYVKVPLLFNLLIPAGGAGKAAARLFVGPQLGVKASCKATVSSGSTSASVGCKDLGLEIKSTDFSAVIGGGLDFNRLTLGIRYDLGLSSIDGSTPSGSVKNRVLALTVGYGFRLK
ncbi:MAG: porin family protein [Gemmatimonadota bacterium]